MALEIQLDYDRGVPVYRQIYEAVISALSTGALDRRERLPTIHELAARLQINPNTVAHAYRELERDGHVVGRRGQGTFPAPKARPEPPPERDRVLHGIFERSLQEAARHGIDARQILAYFRRAIDDDI